MEHNSENTQRLFEHRQYISNPALNTNNSALAGEAAFFSVVSYNILAECHRVRTDYSYTEEEYLVQDYRHSVLMKELQYLDGDLVCLQEVNPHYFHSCLLPAMIRLGYGGVIQCRTKDFYDEGAATFFRTDMFELESVKGVSLTESAHRVLENVDVNLAVKAAAREYLDHADIVLITRLHFKTSGQVLTVGNVHIWWDSDLHPDVKTVQASCAVQEVVGVSGIGGPHVICGDFNSDSCSPLYQLVTDGCLSDSSVRQLQAVQCLQLDNAVSKSLVDHFKDAIHHQSPKLRSSYSTVMGSEPELTCFTDRKWQLDYIFYSADSLAVLGVLGMVDTDTVFKTGGLPSQDFPSDHLALKTCFTFA